MTLTVDDVNAVVAQWEEWTADAGFRLSIEVKDDGPPAAMLGVDVEYSDALPAQLGARMESLLYLQVQIRRGEDLVFDQSVPYDAAMLRASVTTLARYIAANGDHDS